MSPWAKLNNDGKLLLACCIINLTIAIVLAKEGSYFCFFPLAFSMFCGLSTLMDKFQK